MRYDALSLSIVDCGIDHIGFSKNNPQRTIEQVFLIAFHAVFAGGGERLSQEGCALFKLLFDDIKLAACEERSERDRD